MREERSAFRRVFDSGRLYAVAGVGQQALAFLLLPVYTRLLPPDEYGILEILIVFSAVAFGLLLLGLPPAIVKCFHRDARDDAERERVLGTALRLATPCLFVGAFAAWFYAPSLSELLLGDPSHADGVRLVAAYGALNSVFTLVLSLLKAQERASTYVALALSQVAIALVLNLLFVAVLRLGFRGVLWGNLASMALVVPIALVLAARGNRAAWSSRLAEPMLRFGLLLLPAVLASWIIQSSDRYVLRLYDELGTVAVYGVGYKIGMLVEILVVMPFQMAWPAVAFSIAEDEDHQRVYARTLAYLTALLAFSCVALSLLSKLALPWVVGADYAEAYRVVPLVSLGYALHGMQSCLEPGIHVAGRTRYLTMLMIGGAALNLGLNFLLVPSLGLMGAAIATAASFGAMALLTGLVSKSFHPVEYQPVRLIALAAVAGAAFAAGSLLPLEPGGVAVLQHLLLALVLLPGGLAAVLLTDGETRSAVSSRLASLRSQSS